MTSTKPSNNAEIESWLSRPAAKRLLSLEQDYLRRTLTDYSGSRALFLGPELVLCDLPLQNLGGMVWQLEPQFDLSDEIGESVRFVGDLLFSGLSWPFQDESLDLVVLCHSLPTAVADSVLMEAWRVLAPEGQIIVTAIHDHKCPMFLDYEVLRAAISVISEPLLSNRHYCSKLPFSWRGNVPRLISSLCPLHILQWIKHKPAMIKRLQFKLPKSQPVVPVPVNMGRGSLDEGY